MESPRALAGRAVGVVLEKTLELNRSAVLAHLRRLRRTRPDATPAELLKALERHYLAAVTAGGVLAGGAAAVPGVGVGMGAVVNLAQVPAFFEATALLALSYAEVHGVPVDDLERRKTLVFGTLLGEGGSKIIMKFGGRFGKHWGKFLAGAIDLKTLKAINNVLGPNVVTKWGTKQGILVLGRELPLGIGAGVGGAGKAGFGYLSIRSVRRAFGPPPFIFPTDRSPRPASDPKPARDESPPSADATGAPPADSN